MFDLLTTLYVIGIIINLILIIIDIICMRVITRLNCLLYVGLLAGSLGATLMYLITWLSITLQKRGYDKSIAKW